MNLLNLTLLAHTRAVQQNRLTPAERRDLEGYPMRWHDDDGVMTPVFDDSRLSDAQVAEISEILEKMAGKKREKDVVLLVRAHMEAFGRFGLRQSDVAAAVGVSKPTALKHLRNLAEAGLVDVREEPNPRKGASPRKRYFWTQNSADFGAEEAFSGAGDDSGSARTANLHIRGDRGRNQSDGSGIVHHGASAHAPQCPDRCSACRSAIQAALADEMRTAARQAGGTGFSVGLAERIAAREAAEEAIYAKLESGSTVRGLSPAERSLWNRDLARKLVRSGA